MRHMRQKRWMIVGGIAIALGAAAALGTAGNAPADSAVRVYLVHAAQHPERGQSSSSVGHGITVFRTAPGTTWPVQVLGYLEDIDEHWVVVRKAAGDDGDHEMHIPRERVQLIEEISEEHLRSLLTPGR